jgi:hypothetical protein
MRRKEVRPGAEAAPLKPTLRITSVFLPHTVPAGLQQVRSPGSPAPATAGSRVAFQ